MARFTERTTRLEGALRDATADAAVLATGRNARYLTGFAGEADRHLLIAITADGERVAVSPERYVEQVRAGVVLDDVRVVPVAENTASAVVDGLAADLPAADGRYLLDGEAAAETAMRLQRALPEASVDLLTPIVEPMRERKDEAELAALGRAARLTDAVSVAIREFGADAIGMTERELAAEIRARLHEKGAEGVAFPVVVAAGPNGARPTAHRHGDRPIERGEPVVLDFGGVFDGYASDQTRTVVFDGEPAEAVVEAHEVVREALETGVERAEPGMTGGDLDAVVRGVIDDRGDADDFVTATGHGVGLRAHEPPSIAPDSDDELEPGMVFSIEPGIYREGAFGVRLETLVALTESGAEPLNDSPYTWRPL